MRIRYLGALLSGVVLSLAFDPVGFAYAAPVAVAGCFVSAHRLAKAAHPGRVSRLPLCWVVAEPLENWRMRDRRFGRACGHHH